MRGVRRLCLIAAVLASQAGARGASALDDDGNANLHGQGASTCAAFGAARKAGKAADYEQWLDGYLSAVNLVLPDTYDILGAKERGAALAWLDQYCAGNAGDAFGFAANRLAAYLYPNRHASKPAK